MEVFKDTVAVIYNKKVPTHIVLNCERHEVVFELREIKGDKVVELLQSLTKQEK